MSSHSATPSKCRSLLPRGTIVQQVLKVLPTCPAASRPISPFRQNGPTAKRTCRTDRKSLQYNNLRALSNFRAAECPQGCSRVGRAARRESSRRLARSQRRRCSVPASLLPVAAGIRRGRRRLRGWSVVDRRVELVCRRRCGSISAGNHCRLSGGRGPGDARRRDGRGIRRHRAALRQRAALCHRGGLCRPSALCRIGHRAEQRRQGTTPEFLGPAVALPRWSLMVSPRVAATC